MFAVNGGFSQWSAWTDCSVKCGTGIQTRGRLCNNPEPKGVNAKSCDGLLTETKPCRLAICQGKKIYIDRYVEGLATY